MRTLDADLPGTTPLIGAELDEELIGELLIEFDGSPVDADVINAYLQERGCVLWGQAFDINSSRGREAAARWFELQLKQLAAFLGEQP